jgi:SAM-dependent methyltransferase
MSDFHLKLQNYYMRLKDRLSLRRLFYFWKAALPAEHLLASIDEASFRGLLKYRDETGHPQYRKYFNAPYWLRQNVARALGLGLHRTLPIRILDIGSGFGYFPYAAHFYGHDVVGLDVPGDVLFDKASEFLGITRKHHTIEFKKKLPLFDKKFDLVTAFQVCFNGHIDGPLWGVEAWEFFLNDVFENHLNDGGRIYLELNWSPHIQGWLPEAVRDLFVETYKARFDGLSRVTLYSPQA